MRLHVSLLCILTILGLPGSVWGDSPDLEGQFDIVLQNLEITPVTPRFKAELLRNFSRDPEWARAAQDAVEGLPTPEFYNRTFQLVAYEIKKDAVMPFVRKETLALANDVFDFSPLSGEMVLKSRISGTLAPEVQVQMLLSGHQFENKITKQFLNPDSLLWSSMPGQMEAFTKEGPTNGIRWINRNQLDEHFKLKPVKELVDKAIAAVRGDEATAPLLSVIFEGYERNPDEYRISIQQIITSRFSRNELEAAFNGRNASTTFKVLQALRSDPEISAKQLNLFLNRLPQQVRLISLLGSNPSTGLRSFLDSPMLSSEALKKISFADDAAARAYLARSYVRFIKEFTPPTVPEIELSALKMRVNGIELSPSELAEVQEVERRLALKHIHHPPEVIAGVKPADPVGSTWVDQNAKKLGPAFELADRAKYYNDIFLPRFFHQADTTGVDLSSSEINSFNQLLDDLAHDRFGALNEELTGQIQHYIARIPEEHYFFQVVSNDGARFLEQLPQIGAKVKANCAVARLKSKFELDNARRRLGALFKSKSNPSFEDMIKAALAASDDPLRFQLKHLSPDQLKAAKEYLVILSKDPALLKSSFHGDLYRALVQEMDILVPNANERAEIISRLLPTYFLPHRHGNEIESINRALASIPLDQHHLKELNRYFNDPISTLHQHFPVPKRTIFNPDQAPYLLEGKPTRAGLIALDSVHENFKDFLVRDFALLQNPHERRKLLDSWFIHGAGLQDNDASLNALFEMLDRGHASPDELRMVADFLHLSPSYQKVIFQAHPSLFLKVLTTTGNAASYLPVYSDWLSEGLAHTAPTDLFAHYRIQQEILRDLGKKGAPENLIQQLLKDYETLHGFAMKGNAKMDALRTTFEKYNQAFMKTATRLSRHTIAPECLRDTLERIAGTSEK